MPAVLNKCRALKRQLDKKEQENSTLKKNVGKLRRQLCKKNELPTSTPVRQAHDLLSELGKAPSQSNVKRVLPYTATITAVKQATLPIKRKIFGPSSSAKRTKISKSLAGDIEKITNVSARYICRRPYTKYRPTRKLLARSRNNLAVRFLKRPDNSSQLPSKKHHVKGQVKYGLTDTMDNLYTKFKSEYTNIRMHIGLHSLQHDRVTLSLFSGPTETNVSVKFVQICLC